MNDKHEKSQVLSEHATSDWADWMMMHRRAIALSCACIFLALVGGVWMLQSRNAHRIKDFETADVLAEELQKNPKLFDAEAARGSDQALAALQKLDDEYEILQPRFDSLIAEEMLLRDKSKQIDPYAKRTITRLRSLGLGDFADFSEVSRLSGLQAYKEALKKATDLKAHLATKKDAASSSHQYLLEAFLLLHIATFHQKLEQHEAMLQTIIELKEYLGLRPRAKPLTPQERALASEMLAHLQERQSSLLEYIEEMPKIAGT